MNKKSYRKLLLGNTVYNLIIGVTKFGLFSVIEKSRPKKFGR
jgi:hypothetical protein